MLRRLNADAQIHNPFTLSDPASSISVDYARGDPQPIAYHYRSRRDSQHTATYFVKSGELVHEYHGHARHLTNLRVDRGAAGKIRGECWFWNDAADKDGRNWRFSHSY